jgi:hypothetical protein
MRPIGIGLAIGLLLATFAAPAFAADVSKDARAKGMAAAPGLVSSAGLDCQVADARLIGESTDPKTKAKSTLYELACTGNEGVIVDVVGDSPKVFTCVEAAAPGPDGKPSSTACVLPGNKDPAAGLTPYVAKIGAPCTIAKVRPLGHSATETYIELACKEGGGGYILEISAPPRLDRPAAMKPCFGYAEDGNIKCILTDRATQAAAVDQLVAQSGKGCAVKDRSVLGVSQKGDIFYEISCQDGKGYVMEQAPNGAVTRTVDCAAADAIGGGCKLTDARQAKTEQDGLYSNLARKAGFQCDVKGYAPLPNSADNRGKEVVELECSNRPDGGIAFFGATSADTSVVYDCAHSELKGYRCSLTKPSAAYPKLTADLKTVGKASCQVSNSRAVALSKDNLTGYVEVACADGLQGYMIEYTMTPVTPKSAIVCSDAKGIGGGCTLPGNAKKS